jgi:superfamily II DNA or RNA helicase
VATNLAQTLKGCRSWADLQRRWRPLTKKQKGNLFEELTKHYLLLEPEYASKLKSVWLLGEVPTALAKRLKLPSNDQGIDLVAETKEGEYWAIQSKYREESDQSITWREISTFTGLAFGVCRGFSYGLIASTTERITNVLKHQDRIGFAALDVWQGLDEEFFKRLQNHLYHKREALKPRLPRPHQNKAIADAFTYFVKKKHKRGKLIMPCGTGKSLTSYFIAQKLKARKILIAVPSLSLIKQTLKAWMYESMARKQDVEWICVCSDESAGKVEQDDAVVLKQDLGVPCLTNSKEIAEWLKHKHNSLTIVFTTYQSGQALAKAARDAAFTFDLGIMDEAHKTAGSKGRVFSHLVLDKNVKISRRLFMTATERRYQGQSDEILSMEDPDDYGETIHKLSFKKALEYKPSILSDYKVVTIHISQEEIADLVRNRAFVRPKSKGWGKEMEAENLAALIALRKAMNKYPIRHAVSFHGSIKRAQDFQESNDAYSKSFPSSGRLQTFHVSGKTPTGTRAKEIDQFSKAPRGLITNARCLTEGVDVPNIDAVLFADPRRSLVDIVQAVGRALRPSPNKKFGYVIVPVVHKKNAKPNDIFDSDSFKEVLTTLRALGSQDDRIIEYFRAVSQGRHPKGRRPFEGVLTEILAKKIDLREFVRSVELRCWDRLAKLSWRPFIEARSFARSLGLKSLEEWSEKYTKGEIPADIPIAPWGVYKDSGWISAGDWLGTGNIATQKRVYIDYKKAEKIVRSLGLQNQTEWYNTTRAKNKKPAILEGIPNNPHQTYKDEGWKTWNEWLGTKPKGNRKFLSFVKARAVIRKLKFKSQKEFFSFCRGRDPLGRKLPINISATPHGTYKSSGWKGYGDWLGTGIRGTQERPYWSYEKCSVFMKSKAFTKQDDFIEFSKSPEYRKKYINYIPYNPQKVFKKKWKGWGHYLKTGNVATYQRKYLPFTAARKIVRKVGFKTIKEWRKACRGILLNRGSIPINVPANPNYVYRNKGWKGFGDWLGTGNLSPIRKFCSFSKAKKWALENKIKSGLEWKQMTIKLGSEFPQNIPRVPFVAYKGKGWCGWPSFLSSDKWNPLRKICSYAEAKKFARKNKIITCTQWMRFLKAKGNKACRDIPRAPDQVYIGKGWKSWPNFLGTDQKR